MQAVIDTRTRWSGLGAAGLAVMEPKTKAMALHVDHCHVTGAIRMLLCNRCNSILGHANDDVEMLLACADYLRRRQGRNDAARSG